MLCWIVLIVTSCVAFTVNSQVDCIAIEHLTRTVEEDWDFQLAGWKNTTVSIASSKYNIPPMSGEYLYELNFCNSVDLYLGDSKSTFGWSYGVLGLFVRFDVNPPENGSIDEYSAFLEFRQWYVDGDVGYPCSFEQPRMSVVNIYCGLDKANCTQVPGNVGPQCINPNGTTQNGFCLCSIIYNDSICGGLTFNVLSNTCPNGEPVVIPTPTPHPPSPGVIIGVSFGVAFTILFGFWLTGLLYNVVVHQKKGWAAAPCFSHDIDESPTVINETSSTRGEGGAHHDNPSSLTYGT